jgi:hypothetical protein
MWKVEPNSSIIIYTQKHIQSVDPKSGTGRGVREEKKRKRVTNTEIHHICVGTRHNETLKMVERHRMGKGEEEWGYPDLAQCICSKMSRENHEQ